MYYTQPYLCLFPGHLTYLPSLLSFFSSQEGGGKDFKMIDEKLLPYSALVESSLDE